MRFDAKRWFTRRTFQSRDWSLSGLRQCKEMTTVSVVLPALNEEKTVGSLVEQLVRFRTETGLIDEIVVMDSGSTDRTAELAQLAGAAVFHRDDVLPEEGSFPGKGEVMWKSLYVTSGEIVVFIDSDLAEFRHDFITGLLGPLLTKEQISLVKGFFDRPENHQVGGGRVTELMARPLLNLHMPLLSGVVQPLSGLTAARRSLLEQLSFASGYGVEVGLLVDTVRLQGVDAIAQVDVGELLHDHQDVSSLGKMSAAVLHTFVTRALPNNTAYPGLTQFQRVNGRIEPVENRVDSYQDRSPMGELRAYTERWAMTPEAVVE